MSYLLHPSTLHAAAPGVLDVIFGPDGDFEGAPEWTPPMWSEKLQCWGHPRVGAAMWFVDEGALDLRIHSVYARLLRLCSFVEFVDADISPEDLAALTLALAPRIAALRGGR